MACKVWLKILELTPFYIFLLSAAGCLKPDSVFSVLVSVSNQRYPWIEQLCLKFVRQIAYYKLYSATAR